MDEQAVGCQGLSRVVLRVRSPEDLAIFYTERLGMVARYEGGAVILGYPGADADIELRPAGRGIYRHGSGDLYWKIGITLPDVDMAAAQLVFPS